MVKLLSTNYRLLSSNLYNREFNLHRNPIKFKPAIRGAKIDDKIKLYSIPQHVDLMHIKHYDGNFEGGKRR